MLQNTSPHDTVPFFGVQRESAAYEEEYSAAILRVLRHGRSLQGPEVAGLEDALAERCGRKFAIAVNSATDALFYALVGAGIGPGDEVLVTSFSFVASASAILRAGATPVFVDIELPSFHMSLDYARRHMTPKTKAILVVHLFGQMLNPTAVEALASESGLIVIEDSAQALGSRWAGRPAGSLGLASVISFDPTKVISAPGSGGAVLTDDPAMRDRVRELRYHGRNAAGEFASLGYNSQMPSLTAAVLELKLGHLDEFQRRRQHVAAAYNTAFRDSGLACPLPSGRSEHSYHKYVLVAPEGSAELRAALTAAHVETMVHYARPLPFELMFAHLQYTSRDLPVACSLQGKLLSLPVHPFLSEDELERVIASVLSVARQRSTRRLTSVSVGQGAPAPDEGTYASNQ